MKRIGIITLFLLFSFVSESLSQPVSGTQVFLITCGPGAETYSHYGHSALRVVIPEKNFDTIYNWGIFDFSTPNFAWKFAKGRLEYWLGAESVPRFLSYYNYEKRYVIQQKVNLDSAEVSVLLSLISENLKPENASYKYDFFYDDCSTRIRDLFEKAVGEKLIYPPDDKDEMPTFRDLTDKYQSSYPWLKFGIDLIMGSPGEKRADFRERMFLPLDLKEGLSQTLINRDGAMVPLLSEPLVLLDFPPLVVKPRLLSSPVAVLSLLLLAVIIFTFKIKNKTIIRRVDIILFFIFSLLSILMIFFNYFSDHIQMQKNLNLVWLNPIIIVCLALLILNRKGIIWFRILFGISGAFLLIHLFLPQEFNVAFIPLVLILLLRSAVRSEYKVLTNI